MIGEFRVTFIVGYDGLVTMVFDNDSINAETFGRHWWTATHARTASSADYLEEAAYAAFSALLGRAEQYPRGWSRDWREQLPTAVLG